MKNYLLLIIVFILLLIITLIICKQNKKELGKPNDLYIIYPFYKPELRQEYIKYYQNHHLSIKQAIIEVNIGLNNPFYQNTKEVITNDSLNIIINKYNYVSKEYKPKNLITINKYSKSNILLNSTVYQAFLEMANAIEKENMHLRIISGYRSYAYQENLYNHYLKTDSQEVVDSYSAKPGYSEHHTGLAIDIDNQTTNYNLFYTTKEFIWMQKNAYKYGFILRYPLGKERITGYKYEPWHYRYVGKKIAKYIYEHQLTYEEYYYEFID